MGPAQERGSGARGGAEGGREAPRLRDLPGARGRARALGMRGRIRLGSPPAPLPRRRGGRRDPDRRGPHPDRAHRLRHGAPLLDRSEWEGPPGRPGDPRRGRGVLHPQLGPDDPVPVRARGLHGKRGQHRGSLVPPGGRRPVAAGARLRRSRAGVPRLGDQGAGLAPPGGRRRGRARQGAPAHLLVGARRGSGAERGILRRAARCAHRAERQEPLARPALAAGSGPPPRSRGARVRRARRAPRARVGQGAVLRVGKSAPDGTRRPGCLTCPPSARRCSPARRRAAGRSPRGCSIGKWPRSSSATGPCSTSRPGRPAEVSRTILGTISSPSSSPPRCWAPPPHATICSRS